MLTVFTRCANCDEQVTVEVSRNESVSNKYYCVKCCSEGTTALATMPVIRGFGDYNSTNTETKTVYQEPVKNAEEKALDELKEFCVGVQYG